MRHNSTKANNAITSANIVTKRQSSSDSIQSMPQQLQQQQQQSQTESSSGGEESTTDAQEKRISSASLSMKSSQRQSLKSDTEKISASGDCSKVCEDGVEESCLLGIDCNERTTIGLVLPILADTTIHLDGDG